MAGIAVVGGAAAIGLAAVPGIAAADPLSEALATTSCNYAQVTAAMNAQTPELAAQLSMRPDMQANLQSFLAMPVEQRRAEIAKQQAANPQLQQMLTALLGPQVSQVAGSCMNY
ncbi:hypothetical protein MPRF_41280 [Mycolicibacterium parafortuitum]|uniref:Hemophore-related protein n=2 Tax=Mycolicibacterium parafortuitum TaxID=39692 RepID=A0A7I7U9J0_MYCPF|nr:hypothetical protein MPRF_41280 [Mycolicibacterium parafortuitum]